MELADTLKPIVDKVNQSEEHSIFALGCKYAPNPADPEKFGIQTFLAVNGFFDLIAEGLYQELRELIENGDPALFYALREVILDLEEEFDIKDTGEEFMDEAPSGKTLH